MILHCCLDVRGAIKTMNQRQLSQMFHRADGTRLNASEAKDALLDHLAEGHEVIPVGPECIGFDYAGGGCPGHESEDVAYPKVMP